MWRLYSYIKLGVWRIKKQTQPRYGLSQADRRHYSIEWAHSLLLLQAAQELHQLFAVTTSMGRWAVGYWRLFRGDNVNITQCSQYPHHRQLPLAVGLALLLGVTRLIHICRPEPTNNDPSWPDIHRAPSH